MREKRDTMPTYSDASKEVSPIIEELITDHCVDLVEAQIAIGAIFAHASTNSNGEPTGPAIIEHGQPVRYKLKIHGEADRVAGTPDATIVIDYEEWTQLQENATTGRKILLAGIHRKLHEMIVKRATDSNAIVTYDNGRPKLKRRKPDWFFTGYTTIAELHGEASYERREARELHETFGQLLFSFIEGLSTQEQFPGMEEKKRKPRKGAAAVSAARR